MGGEGTTREQRQLVINADDLGLSRGINQGIIAAFQCGALRSASVVVNMAAFDEAIQFARQVGASFGLGLHLNLTLGSPITRAPTLVDSRTGRFLSRGRLLAHSLTGRISAAAVINECRAQ